MTDQEWYDYGQAHCGIGVGDTVRVLRKAQDKEMGWGTVWASPMDKSIGQTLIVGSIYGRRGFGCIPDGYVFPFFVLELIRKAEPESPLPQSILDIIDNGFGYEHEKEAIKKLVEEILKQKG